MSDPLYHHCTNFSTVVYNTIVPSEYHTLNYAAGTWFNPDFKDEFYDMDIKANNWLKKEVGFYPLFMSVGNSIYDYYMTGYDDNWRVTLSSWYEGKPKKYYYKKRKKGEFPNLVLFSFDDVDCVFMDHAYWVVGGYTNAINGEEVTNRDKRCIFKYSWTRAKWFRMVKKSGGVQCVVPELDLRQAVRIWVRNNKTKKMMEKMGFTNVVVKRILLEKY